MTALTFQIEGQLTPLDVQSYHFKNEVTPIWSDGTFDGTHIEHIVAYVPSQSIGEIILNTGERITFSNFVEMADGLVIIQNPRIEEKK